eukprot:128401-Prorocentrum_minimum.AAC.1
MLKWHTSYWGRASSCEAPSPAGWRNQRVASRRARSRSIKLADSLSPIRGRRAHLVVVGEGEDLRVHAVVERVRRACPATTATPA